MGQWPVCRHNLPDLQEGQTKETVTETNHRYAGWLSPLHDRLDYLGGEANSCLNFLKAIKIGYETEPVALIQFQHGINARLNRSRAS
jgi:hypothetical protein